jgi:HEAT repeat protein
MGLRACSEVDGAAAPATLIEALRDGPRAVRVEAARALRQTPTTEARAALVLALDDADAPVRHAAGKALRAVGEIEALFPVLKDGSPRAQDEAIVSLTGMPGPAREAVLGWAGRRIAEAERLRRWSTSLSPAQATPAIVGLRSTLALAEDKVESRVLHGLGSAGSAEAIRTVSAACARRPGSSLASGRSPGVHRRSASQPRLVQLLEADTAPTEPEAAALALDELARHSRPWFRALAFRARAEQNRGSGEALSRLAAEDPSPIVRQALASATGDKGMETGQTLGIVERVLFLRDVPIFRLLEPEDLEQIAGAAREQLYSAGDYLCREGDLGEQLFVLVQGEVEVSKQVDGAAHVLRTLHSGDHLGELAILREQPRSASVRALTETRTLVLSGDALRSILEDRPEVSLAMLASLADRMSSLA